VAKVVKSEDKHSKKGKHAKTVAIKKVARAAKHTDKKVVKKTIKHISKKEKRANKKAHKAIKKAHKAIKEEKKHTISHKKAV
jgi:hypothetical protein